jgi:hypothetical protein
MGRLITLVTILNVLIFATLENYFTKGIILCHYDIYIQHYIVPIWYECSTSVEQREQKKKSPICTRNNISSENNCNKILSIKECREVTDIHRIVIQETKPSTLHSDS